jgi:CII-binding regulator of phage lambda lysogenization HflD
MSDFADLQQKIVGLADRLKAFQQERDRRTRLAVTMLADIEHKVRTQRAALEEANARIAQLEQEREMIVARVIEVVDLYESSLANNDAFFQGIESLAGKLTGTPVRALSPEGESTHGPAEPTADAGQQGPKT